MQPRTAIPSFLAMGHFTPVADRSSFCSRAFILYIDELAPSSGCLCYIICTAALVPAILKNTVEHGERVTLRKHFKIQIFNMEVKFSAKFLNLCSLITG